MTCPPNEACPHVRASERWRDALLAAGGGVTWIDLPARGMRGNSHALIADDNSAEIAGRALDWMTARDLVHR